MNRDHWVIWAFGMLGSASTVIQSFVHNAQDYIGFVGGLMGVGLTGVTLAIQWKKWQDLNRPKDKQ